MVLLLSALAVNLLMAGCSTRKTLHIEDQPLAVPIVDQNGNDTFLRGHICRPAGVERPQLVIINHGSPGNPAERAGMVAIPCRAEAVRWFLERNYAVVIVLRLGYGSTGGTWLEAKPNCDDVDHYQAGLDTAREIDTIVDYAVALPDVDPKDVIVVGHSAGGWATLAYDSLPHPHVSAFINMAGGVGGHGAHYPDPSDSVCHPDQLMTAASRYGHTATTPMLWVYSANDSFFGPQLADGMLENFRLAGGEVDMFRAGPYGPDGHALFIGQGGSAIWGPAVENYLAARRRAAAD